LGKTDVEDELHALKPEELALIRRLDDAQQPPKSTHPSVSTNAAAAHLIQVAKAPHDKKSNVRFVCKAELFCSRRQTTVFLIYH